jgi:F0F1-type ATP synthase membrane subunit c/vacuolar-type H+-ATPase subunit K
MRLWLVYCSAVLVIIVVGVAVAAFAPPEGEMQTGPAALLVLLAPAAGFLAVTRRRYTAQTRAELAAEHRQRFFLGVALAESPALFGLVGLFLTGALWVVLAGGALSLALLALHAPTERAIDREDERLRSAGSPVTLSEALSGRAGP